MKSLILKLNYVEKSVLIKLSQKLCNAYNVIMCSETNTDGSLCSTSIFFVFKCHIKYAFLFSSIFLFCWFYVDEETFCQGVVCNIKWHCPTFSNVFLHIYYSHVYIRCHNTKRHKLLLSMRTCEHTPFIFKVLTSTGLICNTSSWKRKLVALCAWYSALLWVK